MYYEGKVYRPWMEANSLLIQTTLGCTHNKCTFCDMFREKRFRIRKIEEIFEDIDEARNTFRHIEAIFLIDGNVLALKTAFLVKILGKIASTFPECSKIALYGYWAHSCKKLRSSRAVHLPTVQMLEGGQRRTQWSLGIAR